MYDMVKCYLPHLWIHLVKYSSSMGPFSLICFCWLTLGTQPTEARAIVKYNRRKHVITTDIQIPDYDVEAGFRLGVIDGNTKGKGTHSISLDLINKNIPELSLVGRAK